LRYVWADCHGCRAAIRLATVACTAAFASAVGAMPTANMMYGAANADTAPCPGSGLATAPP
jgi:hypothetical protein